MRLCQKLRVMPVRLLCIIMRFFKDVAVRFMTRRPRWRVARMHTYISGFGVRTPIGRGRNCTGREWVIAEGAPQQGWHAGSGGRACVWPCVV